MTTAPATAVADPPPDQTTPSRDPVGEWLAKRGVLWLLLQAPVIGVLISYVSGLERLNSAVFPVFVAFSVLTGWVAYRKAKSTDPAEPINRLHLYALYAMLPVAAFSVVQIPWLFGGADLAYWATWLELGTQFIASGVDPWSFLAGVVWSLLVGIGLVLGYYVLFERHGLINAGLYFGLVFLAALYVLPAFSPVTANAGGLWYLMTTVAFATLAATAWAMPAFWTWVARPGRSRRPDRPRVVALAGAVLVFLAPYALAAERTANWQLDEQAARDLAAFDQVTLEADGTPVRFRGVDGETASYELALRLWAPLYTTAAGAERVVSAGPALVEGTLETSGTSAAWCTGYLAESDSPDALRAPGTFAVAARDPEHIAVTLSCSGPAAAVDDLCAAGLVLTIRWRADVTLVGERITRQRELSDQAAATVELRDDVTC